MRILVIGDVMLDRRVEGTLPRISPEAPVPVLKMHAYSASPGGAGNVAANLIGLGADVQLVGLAGNTGAQVELEYQLGAANVPYHLIPSDRPTAVKTRLTSGGQQLYRVDEDPPPGMANVEVDGAIEALERKAPFDAVVISDYAKGFPWNNMRRLRQICVERRLPVFVDAKPANFGYFMNCTYMTPNLSEAEQLAERYVHPALAQGAVPLPERSLLLGRVIRGQFRCLNVVITLGSAGATWIGETGEQHVPTDVQAVCDVAGAGDTFLAALTVSALSGSAPPEAVKIANAAAGLAVRQHGTTVITRGQLQEELRRRDGWSSKIMTEAALLDYVSRQRASGKRIVFTNGCFDLLHPGHLRFLEAVKKFGHVLVVGINTDESVRQLKGEGRPIITLADRMAMLAMCPFVDAVTSFATPSPEPLIRHLRPEVLAKGAEYRETVVPGADFVASHGGQVLFVEMTPGYSTSELVRRLGGAHG